jgi:uncharacterized protein (DUF2252 family)
MRDAITEFKRFNLPFARRSAELVRHKVDAMAKSPFAFFRGAFHLFSADVVNSIGGPMPLPESFPEWDIVGDLHCDNYGTFKAADEVIHYDVNDFDETTTGRIDFDICRLATSLFLAAREPEGSELKSSVAVVVTVAQAYAQAMQHQFNKGKGHAEVIDEKTPSGCAVIDDLVRTMWATKRTDYIHKLTHKTDGGRKFILSEKYFRVTDAERERVNRLLTDYLKRHGKPEGDAFWTVEDIAGRIAGVGSLGRDRFAVLLKGKGDADAHNVVMELKEAQPSGYDLARKRPAKLAARAEYVITMQAKSQAASSPFLGYATDGGASFQIRQLGPHDNRVDSGSQKPAVLEGLAQIQAKILARVHARAAARAGGPTALPAELADVDGFAHRVVAFALSYADVVKRDWTRFAAAKVELDRVEEWAKG